MKVLELFSGTECISTEFRKRGHEAFTVDWNERFPSSLHCDIGSLSASDIIGRFGKPDVIFAAFDCTTFSLLAMRKHRRYNPMTGEMEAVSEYAKQCDRIDKHVLELIAELEPKVFIIENPRAGLRTMQWMKWAKPQTTTYCQYGASYMKPTDFWSNIDLRLAKPCKAGSDCHSRAREGLVKITDRAVRSMYPQGLVEHIVDMVELGIKLSRSAWSECGKN